MLTSGFKFRANEITPEAADLALQQRKIDSFFLLITRMNHSCVNLVLFVHFDVFFCSFFLCVCANWASVSTWRWIRAKTIQLPSLDPERSSMEVLFLLAGFPSRPKALAPHMLTWPKPADDTNRRSGSPSSSFTHSRLHSFVCVRKSRGVFEALQLLNDRRENRERRYTTQC